MKKIVESYLEFLQSTAIMQDGRAATTYSANPKKMSKKATLADLANRYAIRHRLPRNHR